MRFLLEGFLLQITNASPHPPLYPEKDRLGEWHGFDHVNKSRTSFKKKSRYKSEHHKISHILE